MEYLKPIQDIERLDRDDVFRKSTKFDRPDFGSNIPFELFSALSSLHMSHKQTHDKDEDKDDDKDVYPHQNQDIEEAGEDTDHNEAHDGTEEDGESAQKNDADKHSPESGDDSTNPHDESSGDVATEVKKHEHHDTVTVDAKTVSENPPGSQEKTVPAEFEVRLKHSKSIDEQVIDTKQDNDLIAEREESNLRRKSIDQTPHEDAPKDPSLTESSENQSKDKSPADSAEAMLKDTTPEK
jgi:hypothetical protein